MNFKGFIRMRPPLGPIGDAAGLSTPAPVPLWWQLRRLSALSDATNTKIIAALLTLAACVLGAAIAVPQATVITIVPHDPFIFFGMAHRLASGQLPHLDFQTPLGALTAFLPYWAYRLAGDFSGLMPTLHGIAVAAALAPMIYVLATRLRYYLAVPIGLYMLLLLAAPMVTGDAPATLTPAMWYNRIGWVAFSLLLFLYLPPCRRTPSTVMLDGVLAGALLACLFYLKITFAIGAAGIVGLWFLLRADARATVLIAVGVAAAIAAVVEIRFGLHQAYLADIAYVLDAAPTVKGGVLAPIKGLIKVVHPLTIVALALAIGAWWRCLSWRDAVFIAAFVAVGYGIANQNTADKELVTVAMVVAFAAECLARAGGRRGGTTLLLPLYAVLGLLLLVLMEPLMWRSAGLGFHLAAALDAPDETGLPSSLARFHILQKVQGGAILGEEAGVLGEILAPGLTAEKAYELLRDQKRLNTFEPLSNDEYVYTIRAGIDALAGIANDDDRIFNFDGVNPFPFLLGTPPPIGDQFCYDFGRQNSAEVFIPAEDFLPSVDLVMVPRFPLGGLDHDAMAVQYGDYLRRHFRQVRETPFWFVWRRSTPSTAMATVDHL